MKRLLADSALHKACAQMHWADCIVLHIRRMLGINNSSHKTVLGTIKDKKNLDLKRNLMKLCFKGIIGDVIKIPYRLNIR